MTLKHFSWMCSLAALLIIGGCMRSPENVSPQTAKPSSHLDCVLLLHQLLSEEQHLSKLLLVKKEPEALEALVKQIYTSTKTAYEKEAAAKGWKGNIAGGLTFFTVVAMTVYHDAEEPSDAALDAHFKTLNAALDETPGFADLSNKEKQGFNNVMIGFGGILLAGYAEGKQNADAETLANYRKLAGMLIEMVLKTDPKNLRLVNGQIVMN